MIYSRWHDLLQLPALFYLSFFWKKPSQDRQWCCDPRGWAGPSGCSLSIRAATCERVMQLEPTVYSTFVWCSLLTCTRALCRVCKDTLAECWRSAQGPRRQKNLAPDQRLLGSSTGTRELAKSQMAHADEIPLLKDPLLKEISSGKLIGLQNCIEMYLHGRKYWSEIGPLKYNMPGIMAMTRDKSCPNEKNLRGCHASTNP